jgi:hypothetical protein
LLAEKQGGTHLSISQKNCVTSPFRRNTRVSLVRSAGRLILWVSRQDCESRRPAVIPEAGEELRSRGLEKGELPDSGVELVYANLS